MFIDHQLLNGGITELLCWAAQIFGYHDNQTLADYEGVAISAYNDHISNSEVTPLTPLT